MTKTSSLLNRALNAHYQEVCAAYMGRWEFQFSYHFSQLKEQYKEGLITFDEMMLKVFTSLVFIGFSGTVIEDMVQEYCDIAHDFRHRFSELGEMCPLAWDRLDKDHHVGAFLYHVGHVLDSTIPARLGIQPQLNV